MRTPWFFDFDIDVGVRQRKRMAERNQVGSSLRRSDAGDAGDLERIAFRILRKLLQALFRACASKAWALAERRVSGFAETSTMRGDPAAS